MAYTLRSGMLVSFVDPDADNVMRRLQGVLIVRDVDAKTGAVTWLVQDITDKKQFWVALEEEITPVGSVN